MLNSSMLRRMTVMFATPCSDSNIKTNFHRSMFNLASAAVMAGLRCASCLVSGPLVPFNRNTIVKLFLAQNQYSHLFFVDSDISFEPEAVFRLLLADRDVAAGDYPRKELGSTAKYHYKLVENAEIDEDKFIEVIEIPTGFLCIKRKVLVRLIQKHPELHYINDGDDPHKELNYRLFDCMSEPETSRYLSEDFAFCRRWRDAGGKIYMDTTCNLGHLGQIEFKGDLASSLDKK